MPSAIPTGKEVITRFTNCRLVKGDSLITQDLWVSSASGCICHDQEIFYGSQVIPDITIDLNNRIISPGLIDVQLNGCFSFNFSQIPEEGEDVSNYGKGLRAASKSLIQTGVTSFCPTLTSEKTEVYHTALPFLGPSGGDRNPWVGSESLGAHCEGPFINPSKNGIHKIANIIPAHSFADLESSYGKENLFGTETLLPSIKMITAAPEVANMTKIIPEIVERGIIYSVGHTEATYEEAEKAVDAGATMITHLFNAMRPLHHRNPNVFGTLGLPPSVPLPKNKTLMSTPGATTPESSTTPSITSITHQHPNHHQHPPRPFFGIIADGIHLHPTTISIAYHAHPSGFILVTDAMHLLGLPNGTYPWTNGLHITKVNHLLTLEDTDTIAGSSITLIECVSNFMNWTGESIEKAIGAVTVTPAKMLGLQGKKGCLDGGADADLCVLEEVEVLGEDGEVRRELRVDQVWKFGVRVWEREGESIL